VEGVLSCNALPDNTVTQALRSLSDLRNLYLTGFSISETNTLTVLETCNSEFEQCYFILC